MSDLNPAQALGVDYGSKKVGLALASLSAKLPSPFKTLENSQSLIKDLIDIINSQNIKYVVVGLPRNLSGNKTSQTLDTEEFIDRLKEATDLPVIIKDETLTSVLAETELSNTKPTYAKVDVDALAATYILDDWLKEDYKDNHD